jgi:hypothetical protein
MTSVFTLRRPFTLAAALAVTALAGSLATPAGACDNDNTTSSATASTAAHTQCTEKYSCCGGPTGATAAKSGHATRAAKAKKSSAAKAPTPANAAATRPTTLTASGLTITIDPQTGQLVKPTPDQLRALGLAAQTAPASEIRRAPLEVRQMPDGGALLMMDDRFASHATARIGADGQLYYDCEQDPALGAPALATPATPAKPAAPAVAAPAPRHETR